MLLYKISNKSNNLIEESSEKQAHNSFKQNTLKYTIAGGYINDATWKNFRASQRWKMA